MVDPELATEDYISIDEDDEDDEDGDEVTLLQSFLLSAPSHHLPLRSLPDIAPGSYRVRPSKINIRVCDHSARSPPSSSRWQRFFVP